MHGFFNMVTIGKCEICGKEQVEGIREGVTEKLHGFESHRNGVEFCVDCFDENTYINDYGFIFLKFKKGLFCYKPPQYLDYGFRQVLSEGEIERAFNPDFHRFMEWRNK